MGLGYKQICSAKTRNLEKSILSFVWCLQADISPPAHALQDHLSQKRFAADGWRIPCQLAVFFPRDCATLAARL